MKRVLLLLLLVMLSHRASEAQYPRPAGRSINNVFEMGLHLNFSRFSRLVIVDSGGGGDFPRLGTGTGNWRVTNGALDYIATLPDGSDPSLCSPDAGTLRPCHNWSNPYVVLLNLGKGGTADPDHFEPPPGYSETRIAIPAYTEVQGLVAGHNSPVFLGMGGPVVTLTATAGPLVTTASGVSVTNVSFRWEGVPTGYIKALELLGPDYFGVLTNVSVSVSTTASGSLVCGSNGRGSGSSACATDGIVVTAGGGYFYGSSVVIAGNTLGRALVNNDASVGFSAYGGRIEGESGCTVLIENAAAGPVALYEGVRIAQGTVVGGGTGGCTNNLVNSGGGVLAVVGGVTYYSSSGTITNSPGHFSSLYLDKQTPASATAACVVNQLAFDASFVYVCVATNNWKRVGISTW